LAVHITQILQIIKKLPMEKIISITSVYSRCNFSHVFLELNLHIFKKMLRICIISVFRISATLLNPVVNFINIKHMIFRTNVCFGSFYYVHVTRKKLPK